MRLALGVVLLVIGSAATTMYVTAWRHGRGFGEQALAQASARPDSERAPLADGGPEPGSAGPAPGAAAAPAGAPEPPTESWYQYIDDGGSARFASSLAEVPARYREDATQLEMARLQRTKGPAPSPVLRRRRVPVREVEQVWGGGSRGEVILYGASWCGACRKAIAYLEQRGVDFEMKDVEDDPDAEAEYLRKSNGRRGIPLIDVGGQILQGFSPRALDAALANRG